MASQTGSGGLPANSAEILAEVIGIAALVGTLAERAEALLATLQRVVRFDAGWVTLLPPGQQAHASLARFGYDERVLGFLDSPDLLADVERVGGRRSSQTLRLSDLPVPSSEMVGWAEYLEPAGFRDAVGTGLFTPDGRYLGVLTVHTEAADRISESARDLLDMLATPIAFAVDPWRSLITIAGLVRGATGGAVLGPSGAVLPLPGLLGHRLFLRGSDVLAVAAEQVTVGGPYATFLAPSPAVGRDPDGEGAYVRITVVAAPPDVRSFGVAVVLVGPAPDLHGLSGRELQVLGWLVTGASNERIAAALAITVRTVEAHVDHVRAKLGVRSRTAAAARALRLGLFVPSSLQARA